MKKIILSISILLSGIAFGQSKYKLSDLRGHMEAFYEFNDNWELIKVAEADVVSDSLKCEFIQTETIKKLNRIRVEKGMPELVVDIRLKPAATHNAYYNRYCWKHEIFQPGEEWAQKGKFTLTHTQRVDIPNHEEILWPDQRIRLLQPNVFSEITEELTMISNSFDETYQQIIDHILRNYKGCSAHWNALTKNPKWDSVYFYMDRINSRCYIILGQYK